LTGWKIDVRSESEAEEETRRARSSLGAIPGVNDMVAELLYQSGFKSAEEVAEAELEAILEVEGIAREKAETIYKSSRDYVAEKKRKEEEEKAKAAAPVEPEAPPAEEAGDSTGDKGQTDGADR
jgi:N utilization substance protein A